jgi:hypothetical protein
MNRAVGKVLLAVVVAAAETFIETMKCIPSLLTATF